MNLDRWGMQFVNFFYIHVLFPLPLLFQNWWIFISGCGEIFFHAFLSRQFTVWFTWFSILIVREMDEKWKIECGKLGWKITIDMENGWSFNDVWCLTTEKFIILWKSRNFRFNWEKRENFFLDSDLKSSPFIMRKSFFFNIPACGHEAFPHQQWSALQPSQIQLIYHRSVWTAFLIFSHFSPLKDAINYTCRQSFHLGLR